MTMNLALSAMYSCCLNFGNEPSAKCFSKKMKDWAKQGMPACKWGQLGEGVLKKRASPEPSEFRRVTYRNPTVL